MAPVLITAVAKASKPVAKALIKGGIIAYKKSRSAIAETGEVLEDLIAKAKVELFIQFHDQLLFIVKGFLSMAIANLLLIT